MTEASPARQRLTASPEEVLSRLPSIGKLMIIARANGVTHERIGVVEKLEKRDNHILCSGRSHDSAIDLAPVAAVIADRSGRMKEKALPRLEFHDASGKTLFGIVTLDGMAAFDAALGAFFGAALDTPEKETPQASILTDDEPGARPLQQASKTEANVIIEMSVPGLRQAWRGVVPAINPAMGFINIITPDFHLHLRGGAVAKWKRHDDAGQVLLHALGRDGKSLGLVLRGKAETFGMA